jgi:hypothetical protein
MNAETVPSASLVEAADEITATFARHKLGVSTEALALALYYIVATNVPAGQRLACLEQVCKQVLALHDQLNNELH